MVIYCKNTYSARNCEMLESSPIEIITGYMGRLIKWRDLATTKNYTDDGIITMGSELRRFADHRTRKN
jgi:hypothetical protein